MDLVKYSKHKFFILIDLRDRMPSDKLFILGTTLMLIKTCIVMVLKTTLWNES